MVVLDEDLMAVLLAGAASSHILAEVDEFDDVGVVDVGPAHELRVAGDHFLLSAVVEVVLVDEFFGDGVAIGVVIEFDPVLDHQAGFLLETVPHSILTYNLRIIIIKYIYHCNGCLGNNV